MDLAKPKLNYSVPYVLICGSYKRSRTNDKLCDLLGSELARHGIGLISAGGDPGIKVAQSMDKTLTDLNQYEPTKIITVYRKKLREVIKIKRFGCIYFVGNNLDEIRSFLFSKANVLIVIGGALKTKEEVLLAQEMNIPVIPVSMTNGTANEIWQQYLQAGRYKDEALFRQLNTKNASIASGAIIRILTELFSKRD